MALEPPVNKIGGSSQNWLLAQMKKAKAGRGEVIIPFNRCLRASQVALESSPANAGDARDMGLSLGWGDPLEDKMVTHFSILAW